MTVGTRTIGLYVEKPAFGSPCNGCGLCCIVQQCPISIGLFGKAVRCPALEQDGVSFGCGLISNIAAYVPDLGDDCGPALSEALALALGAGAGCDGQHDDEVVPVEAREGMRQRARAAIEAASSPVRELFDFMTSGHGRS